jgi:hypothetical protein
MAQKNDLTLFSNAFRHHSNPGYERTLSLLVIRYPKIHMNFLRTILPAYNIQLKINLLNMLRESSVEMRMIDVVVFYNSWTINNHTSYLLCYYFHKKIQIVFSKLIDPYLSLALYSPNHM